MNIQEHLNNLIRGNHLGLEAYLREVCKSEHINETEAYMRDIEEYARFRFLKYTNCYIDVLKSHQHGTQRGNCHE